MGSRNRLNALETIIAKLRTDSARVEAMHALTPTNPRLKKQKGAIEKVLFLALAEISKLRKTAAGHQEPPD